jgi:hypothetical protein
VDHPADHHGLHGAAAFVRRGGRGRHADCAGSQGPPGGPTPQQTTLRTTWWTASARTVAVKRLVGWRAGVKRVRPGHSVPEHASLHVGLWISPRHLTPHRVSATSSGSSYKQFGARTGELHRSARYQHPHACIRMHACGDQRIVHAAFFALAHWCALVEYRTLAADTRTSRPSQM